MTRRIDLVDPSREELEASLGVRVDPDVMEALLAPGTGLRERTLGVSTGLILVSTLIQLALFRWRRWI